MSRKPFIAGNWKMNNTIAEAEELIQALLPRVGAVEDVDIVVAPSFLSLQAVVDSARGSAVQVYAQNMHEKDSGAFTGDVSAPMLEEIDVAGVILGHSERRQFFGETDKALQAKVPRALEAGLDPDPLRRRDRGGARARRDRAQAPPPGPGRPRQGPARAAARGRRGLRADLGDRHRPDRDARAGAGRDRVRARARAGLRQGGRQPGARALRRLDEGRQRGRAARPARRRRRR